MKMTHDQQLNLLSNLRLNGGSISLSSLYRREEFAEMEAMGWLEYKLAGGFSPYLQITREGYIAAWERPPKPICKTCNGTEWVCECHPDKPWGDQPNSGPNACHCGGAGKPCPECNPLSKESPDGRT